jgi:hypothetical protein
MELLGLLAVMNGSVADYSRHALTPTGLPPSGKVRASPEINLLLTSLWKVNRQFG